MHRLVSPSRSPIGLGTMERTAPPLAWGPSYLKGTSDPGVQGPHTDSYLLVSAWCGGCFIWSH